MRNWDPSRSESHQACVNKAVCCLQQRHLHLGTLPCSVSHDFSHWVFHEFPPSFLLNFMAENMIFFKFFLEKRFTD